MKQKLNCKVFEFLEDKTVASMTLSDPFKAEVQGKCSKLTQRIVEIFFGMASKSFVGTATIEKEDEQNINIGIDVAGMKCDRKYHDYMARQYNQVIKYLSKVCRELEVLMETHIKKVENITEDLEQERYIPRK